MDSDDNILHPPDENMPEWNINNVKNWPPITWADIYNYLVEKETYDHQQMKAYRSLEAYNYVINGWVGDVSSCIYNDKHYLKAKVSPSQLGKFKEPYNAWVAAKSDGEVITGSCSCPAGLGQSCSHVANILFAAFLVWQKGQIGESCTDLPALWGKGTKRTVSPSRVENIDFKKPKCMFPDGNLPSKQKSDNRSYVQQFYCHKDLKEYIENSIFQNLAAIPGTMLNKTINCNLQHAPITVLKIKSNLEEHDSHDYNFNSPLTINSITCAPCRNFYSKFIAISEEKQIQLSVKTSTQDTDLWLDARKIRISASRANSVPKTTRGNPHKFVKTNLYSTFKGNKNTMHGLKNEENARKLLAEIVDAPVQKQGIVLCKEDPWVAASPDGICNNSLVEIKCPVTDIKKLIDSSEYDVRKDDGQLYLYEKGSNGYFMQVQIGMHCLNVDSCYFFFFVV